MKIINKIFVLISILIITQISCEKILFGEPETGNTIVFEEIWQHIKDYYCCHEFVDVNWDSIRQVYSERVDDNMDNADFLILMDEMLQHLKDTKVGIIAESGNFYYEDTTQYAANLDTNTVKFYNPTYSSIIIDDIGYVNRNIGWANSYYGPLSFNPKGLIIDMRDMGRETESEGGMNNLGLFQIDYEAPIGTILLKAGPGEDNFISTPHYIYEVSFELSVKYEEPVVVLTNRKVAGNWARLVFQLASLPNVTLMGDQTSEYGASVPCYLLSNGWLLECPASAILDLSDNCVNCHGIEPDIYVNDDPTSTEIDEIIDAALQFLN